MKPGVSVECIATRVVSALQLAEIAAQVEVTQFSHCQDIAVNPQKASQTAYQPLISQRHWPLAS